MIVLIVFNLFWAANTASICPLSVERGEFFLVLWKSIFACRRWQVDRCGLIEALTFITANITVLISILLVAVVQIGWWWAEVGAITSLGARIYVFIIASVVTGAALGSCDDQILINLGSVACWRWLVFTNVMWVSLRAKAGGSGYSFCRAHDLLNPLLRSHQELLLLSNDHTSAADPHPCNERLSVEAELVHDVEAN